MTSALSDNRLSSQLTGTANVYRCPYCKIDLITSKTPQSMLVALANGNIIRWKEGKLAFVVNEHSYTLKHPGEHRFTFKGSQVEIQPIELGSPSLEETEHELVCPENGRATYTYFT